MAGGYGYRSNSVTEQDEFMSVARNDFLIIWRGHKNGAAREPAQ